MATNDRNLSSVITGNLVTVRFANQVVGLIQGINVNEDFGMQPVSGLGDILPVEFTPGMARIQISASTVYLAKGKIQNLVPDSVLGGQLGNSLVTSFDGAGLAPPKAQHILRGRHFTIQIYAQKLSADYATDITSTGILLRTYEDCVYASGTISFQKHTMVMRDAQFLARNYIDGNA